MNVESLSDAELRAQLEAHGVKVGAFTGTTRGLYVKKLSKLLGASEATPAVHAEPNGDHADVVPDEPIVEKKIYPVLDEQPTRQRRKAAQKEATPPPQEEEHESDYDGEESMRFLTEEEIQADLNRSRRGSPTPAKSSFGISTLIYLILILVAIVFTFFLFENAAKDSGNKDAL